MIHIYEKTCKTESNYYGITEIQNKDVFQKGPAIIVIIHGPF